jgi:Transcriptional regulator
MDSSKRHLDKDSLVQSAVEIVEEQGLDRLTLQALAAKVGVKAPSLYNHIDSLAELYGRISSFALSRLAETLRDAAVGRSRDEALMAMAIAYRDFALAHPELYKAIIRIPEGGRTVREEGQDFARALYRVLEPYGLDEQELLHVTRVFRSAAHGFVALEQAGFFSSSPDVSVSYRAFFELYIASLPARAGGRS